MNNINRDAKCFNPFRKKNKKKQITVQTIRCFRFEQTVQPCQLVTFVNLLKILLRSYVFSHNGNKQRNKKGC